MIDCFLWLTDHEDVLRFCLFLMAVLWMTLRYGRGVCDE